MKRLLRRTKKDAPVQFDAEWHPLPKDPMPRKESGVVVFDEKHVIFVGGFDENHKGSDAVTMANIETGVYTELAKLNRPKWGCKAIIVNRLFFVFGGYNRDDGYLTDVEVLGLNEPSPSKQRFQLLNQSPLPRALREATLVADNDFIYIIGGCAGSGYLDTFFRIHIESKKWTIMPSMNRRRSGAMAVILKDQLLVFGGHNYDNNNKTYLASVETFPLDNGDNDKYSKSSNASWQLANKTNFLPEGRAFGMAFVMGKDEIVLVGGRGSDGKWLKTFCHLGNGTTIVNPTFWSSSKFNNYSFPPFPGYTYDWDLMSMAVGMDRLFFVTDKRQPHSLEFSCMKHIVAHQFGDKNPEAIQRRDYYDRLLGRKEQHKKEEDGQGKEEATARHPRQKTEEATRRKNESVGMMETQQPQRQNQQQQQLKADKGDASSMVHADSADTDFGTTVTMEEYNALVWHVRTHVTPASNLVAAFANVNVVQLRPCLDMISRHSTDVKRMIDDSIRNQEDEAEVTAILSTPRYRDFYLAMLQLLKSTFKAIDSLSSGLIQGSPGTRKTLLAMVECNKRHGTKSRLDRLQIGKLSAVAVETTIKQFDCIPGSDLVGSTVGFLLSMKESREGAMGAIRVSLFGVLCDVMEHVGGADKALEQITRLTVRCYHDRGMIPERDETFKWRKRQILRIAGAKNRNTPVKEAGAIAAQQVMESISDPSATNPTSKLNKLYKGDDDSHLMPSELSDIVVAEVFGLRVEEVWQLPVIIASIEQGATSQETNQRQPQPTTVVEKSASVPTQSVGETTASTSMMETLLARMAEMERRVEEERAAREEAERRSREMEARHRAELANLRREFGKVKEKKANTDIGEGGLTKAHVDPTQALGDLSKRVGSVEATMGENHTETRQRLDEGELNLAIVAEDASAALNHLGLGSHPVAPAQSEPEIEAEFERLRTKNLKKKQDDKEAKRTRDKLFRGAR